MTFTLPGNWWLLTFMLGTGIYVTRLLVRSGWHWWLERPNPNLGLVAAASQSRPRGNFKPRRGILAMPQVNPHRKGSPSMGARTRARGVMVAIEPYRWNEVCAESINSVRDSLTWEDSDQPGPECTLRWCTSCHGDPPSRRGRARLK